MITFCSQFVIQIEVKPYLGPRSGCGFFCAPMGRASVWLTLFRWAFRYPLGPAVYKMVVTCSQCREYMGRFQRVLVLLKIYLRG